MWRACSLFLTALMELCVMLLFHEEWQQTSKLHCHLIASKERVQQKWPVRCNCGGAVSWLISSWWQCTCHFVFLCMNIWLKENHLFTVLLLTRLPAVQLAFYFQSWRLHLMVSTMIHANCKMHFAKFQTVYIMHCLEQKHGHQLAVYSPQETTLWRLQQ
jgi:hypothetical protein